jgi:capsular exopolysaccharide synthesis family protein
MHTPRPRRQHRGPGQASTHESDADLLGRTHEDPSRSGEGITLQAFLRVLRRRWAVIAAAAIVTCGAAVALAVSKENQYRSTAKLLFRDSGVEETVLGPSSGDTDPERQAATNLELGSVATVETRTAERLRAPGVDRAAVASSVELSASANSDLATVAATTGDPALSARMANVYAEEYISFRRVSDRARAAAAAREVRRRLAGLTASEQSGLAGDTLRRQARALDTLAALRTGDVELVERARPQDNPVSPRPKVNGGVGLLLGLLLGLALAFLLEQLDRRLREPEDVEDAFEVPIVGRIPATRTLRRAGSWPQLGLPPEEAEAFRMLRANLRYLNAAEPVRSVVVTSAASGEGKSTVAWNLAFLEAEAGRSALLIEGNMRRPRLAERLRLPAEAGLSAILAGGVDGEETAITLQSGGAMLDVIPAGPPPPNPAELLESRAMEGLLERCRERYEFVLVDTPPALAVSDVTPLLRQVDGVLVVASPGLTTRDAAVELRNQLRAAHARVIGVVLNRDRGSRSAYGAHGTIRRAGAAAPLARDR